MTEAKRQLKEIRMGRIEIRALEEKREEVETRATRLSQNHSGSGKGGRVGTGDLSGDIVNLLGLEKLLQRRIEREARKESDALAIISRIRNVKYRTILTLYYIAGNQPYTWNEVAEQMGYSVTSVCHDHGKALLEYQKILDEKQVCKQLQSDQ